MQAKAVTFTITVMLDLEDMKPSIDSQVVVEPEFSFLSQVPEVLGAWVNAVGDQLVERQFDGVDND